MTGLWWRLVRFGFRLLYYEFAFTYDFVSKVVSFGAWRYWQRTTLKYLDLQPDALILELAHGTGDLQLDLCAGGYIVFGYDLSPYMGRIAQTKLRQRKLPARLARGRAQQLPFASGTFDAVASTFPTDFIVNPETLIEVHRVLRPAGRFIIVPSGILAGGGVMRNFLEWLYRITGQRQEVAPEITRFFSPYGFQVQSFWEPCPRSQALVIVARKQPQ